MEGLLLVVMLLFGVLLLPIAIYLVGNTVFGAYAGQGFGDFYSSLHADLRNGKGVVIFLVLSPYLVWQLVRFSFRLFFSLSPGRSGHPQN